MGPALNGLFREFKYDYNGIAQIEGRLFEPKYND